jgi:DNA sulfur modification protein DndB
MGLKDLVDTEAARRAEYGRRKKYHSEKTVHPNLREEHEGEGWIHVKDLQSGAKMRKAKSHDELLENRVWCILYQLGYPVMNSGRRFEIEIAKGETPITKQVDVFAKDEETAIVLECKSCEEMQDRDLRKDIAELASLQKPIANAVRQHFGKDFKPKILWAFATWNVIWKKSDLALAASNNIAVIKDREIRYLEEISRSLRAAGRYQFHAEFFKDQKIPELDGKHVPAIATKLGGHKAFIFCATPADLLKISFVNHRDLRDPGGAPAYQRLLKQGRLKKIAAYLEEGNFFPNSILVSFHKKVRFDVSDKSYDGSSQFGSLYLPNAYKSCWIIDGQHRLYGCALADTPPQSLTVIAFERIPPALEANLFATINREQQRVQKRLLDELDGELKWDSPVAKEQLGAISSRAVDILNSETGGPFYDRICAPGMGMTPDQNLTLPQIKLGIMQSALLGRFSKTTDSIIPGACTAKTSEDSLDRLVELLTWYFSKVRDAHPERWDEEKGGYLRNNFGIAGHIRLLGDVCSFMQTETGQTAAELRFKDLTQQIEPYLQPVMRYVKEATADAFASRFKVEFGSGGSKTYFFQLCMLVKAQFPSFEPPGLADHVAEVSADVTEEAEQRWKWINETVHDHVISVLEENFGDNFFQLAITSKEIKARCFEKMMDDHPTEQKPPEVYLDFINLKTIVEYKENWPLFADTLSIQLPDEKKGRHKYIEWFDRVNKIRRIFAHSYGRKLEEKDVETLAFVEEQLREKLPDYVSNK